MTYLNAKSLLEEHGLKTGIESIRKRIKNMNYYADIHYHEKEAVLCEPYETWDELIDDLEAADLIVLCELAKKGERLEKAIKEELEIAERKVKDFSNSLFPSNFFWEYQGKASVLTKIILEGEKE